MSQSPYVYDSKNTKPGQVNYSANLMGSTGPGLNNYTQQSAYSQYPQASRPAQQQQQSPPNQPVVSSNPQQSGMNRTVTGPYGNMAPTYQYDQQQVYGNYGQPVQQYHQQQQPQQQQQQPQQQPQQQQPNFYQQNQPQTGQPQPYGGGIPQYSQSSFVNSYNQGVGSAPAYQAGSATYGYPTASYQNQQGYTSNDTNSPYKPNSQVPQQGSTSGSNINMANIRGGLQSATAPPLIDPNQVPQRPKLTTTFWEDENTVCYQVESRGISVSRREDTNFINGTKLLNVAGMTRGRRDGILKSEKVRYVVKIGAMNLKGVWIPFERALELARNEGIVDLLYPLFVKDIKELYQGPQYSGGLTAAANSNPKNIIPVQVTNTTYTPSAYATREKKLHQSSTPKSEKAKAVQSSQPQQTATTSTSQQSTIPGAQPFNPQHQQIGSNMQYSGYAASGYPYSSQYSQPYTQQSAGTDGHTQPPLNTQHYAPGGYYSYQQPASSDSGAVVGASAPLESDEKRSTHEGEEK